MRELFSHHGEPLTKKESTDYQSRLEQAHRKVFLESAWVRFSEKYKKELDAIMKEIDFESMRDLFREEIKNNSVHTNDTNFLGADRILLIAGNTFNAFSSKAGPIRDQLADYLDAEEDKITLPNDMWGAYFPRENLIDLYPSSISAAKNLYEHGVITDDPTYWEDTDNKMPSLKLLILNTLMHQEVKATSYNEIRGIKAEADAQTAIRTTTGYHLSGAETKHKIDFFRLFNDGVTEKRARELMLKYLERHKDFADPDDIHILQNMWQRGNLQTHDVQVSVVNMIVERISTLTEVPESVVWQAIVNGQQEGKAMAEDNEMQDAFAEIFSEDFYRRLALGTEKELIKLIDEFAIPKSAARRWLDLASAFRGGGVSDHLKTLFPTAPAKEPTSQKDKDKGDKNN